MNIKDLDLDLRIKDGKINGDLLVPGVKLGFDVDVEKLAETLKSPDDDEEQPVDAEPLPDDPAARLEVLKQRTERARQRAEASAARAVRNSARNRFLAQYLGMAASFLGQQADADAGIGIGVELPGADDAARARFGAVWESVKPLRAGVKSGQLDPSATVDAILKAVNFLADNHEKHPPGHPSRLDVPVFEAYERGLYTAFLLELLPEATARFRQECVRLLNEAIDEEGEQARFGDLADSIAELREHYATANIDPASVASGIKQIGEYFVSNQAQCPPGHPARLDAPAFENYTARAFTAFVDELLPDVAFEVRHAITLALESLTARTVDTAG